MFRETTGFLGCLGDFAGRHKPAAVLVAWLAALWLSGTLAFMLDLEVPVGRYVLVQCGARVLCIVTTVVLALWVSGAEDLENPTLGAAVAGLVVCIVLGVMQYEPASNTAVVTCPACGVDWSLAPPPFDKTWAEAYPDSIACWRCNHKTPLEGFAEYKALVKPELEAEP